MTTHTNNLDLITKTIDTQYDLARIELFRALEHLDRFQGIKAKDMGHECRPTYESRGTGELHGAPATWDALHARTELIRDVAQVIALTYGVQPVIDIRENIATCGCRPRKGSWTRYSVRISITWNGRTLTREYLLPEVKP